jgi:CxxC motif-containing protein (DUF1111 family)
MSLLKRRPFKTSAGATISAAFAVACLATALAQTNPTDPGPRGGAAGAGGSIAGLTVKESKFFDAGLEEFQEIQSVLESSDAEEGLGPRFNLNSCAGCHAHPAIGGSSPASNPQTSETVAPLSQINALISLNIIKGSGPIREVRFVSGGAVHDLFTIVGLEGTPPKCNISQPDFAGNLQDLRFRIPTPLFGDGLIEAIEDAAILANEVAPKPFGILGRANRNGNDGTVTRFGWKAQNKSLVIFSGEAYNVEQGITNELFPDERGESGWPDPVECRWVVNAPQDSINYDVTQPQGVPDNVNSFANFMRFLAAPTPVTSYGNVTSQQIELGRSAFVKSGCDVCHKPSIETGNHLNAALSNKTVNLFSDLLVHDIGTGDDISQGLADGSQFRTAPLWGLGQRIFFLHDGSAANLVEAINAHANEAAQVIRNYQGVGDSAHNLTPTERQNLLNFLRSL